MGKKNKSPLEPFMKKTYNRHHISREHRNREFTDDELYAVLSLAKKKQKKVYLVSKRGTVMNGSGHIPLDIDMESKNTILKGGTKAGQIVTKSLENIMSVFISNENIEPYDIYKYQEDKKLRESGDLTIEQVKKKLLEIKNQKIQFCYMKRGSHNIHTWTERKTLIALSDTHLTYGTKAKSKYMFRKISLDHIGHIRKSTKKADNKVVKEYKNLHS